MNSRISFEIRQAAEGVALVAVNARGVCGIYLGEAPAKLVAELRIDFPAYDLAPIMSTQQEIVARVFARIQHSLEYFDLPLDIRGGDFEQMVWAAIRSCPPGETLTPSAIAQSIGASPEAAASVAEACRRNKLAIAVPCHRVVTSDGALSICRWGESIQRALLAREQAPRILGRNSGR
jgi:AraC family transcriptional regulator of adaptative response/methylated-DNA-[protein]-cysteine methyltransferase